MIRLYATLLIAVAMPAMGVASNGFAASLPGPADVGRIKPEDKLPTTERLREEKVILRTATPTVAAPEGAEQIRFVLKDVEILGATAFTKEPRQQNLWVDFGSGRAPRL